MVANKLRTYVIIIIIIISMCQYPRIPKIAVAVVIEWIYLGTSLFVQLSLEVKIIPQLRRKRVIITGFLPIYPLAVLFLFFLQWSTVSYLTFI